MRKITNILAVLLCALTFLIADVYAVEDGILAVVNDEVITHKDLRDYINATYVTLATQGHSQEKLDEVMKDLQQNGLTKLIEDKLILSRANELGMTVNEKVINGKISEVKANYASEEEFNRALVAHGGTMGDMIKKIEEQFKIKFVIDHEIQSKIYISPQEITEFYEKHMNEFKQNEKVNLDSIFVSFKSDKAAAKERAQQALDLIKQGEDFNEVAKKFSDAVSLGTVERGQLLPSIEKVVFHLAPEVPSEIIELETGYYIFRLTGRAPAKVASLADVKEQIRDRIFRNKFRQSYVDWIEKLKSDAFIEIKQ